MIDKIEKIISRKDCPELSFFIWSFKAKEKWKLSLKNIGKNYIMLRYGLTLRFLFEQTIDKWTGSSHVRDLH